MHSQSRLRWAVLCAGLLAAAAAQGHGENEAKAKAQEDAAHGHSHESPEEAKVDDRQSNDRPIEITAEGDNLWHLKTKSRLVKMRLVEQDGKMFAEFLPFTYEGAASPFAADNTVSLEIDPGTAQARLIPMRKEGKGGRLISATPLPSTAAFNAAIHMDEKDHIHRLRFRFPGAK